MKTTKNYVQRMARKKVMVDASIAAATKQRGLLLVLTGNGKGKSSSAFGMAARALGHKLHVVVIQFVKNNATTGEEEFFRNQANIQWHICGAGFTWETANLAKDMEAAHKGWSLACEVLKDSAINMVILDEITYPLRDKLISLDACLEALVARPTMQHVIITGRGAPQALIEVADTVTEVQDSKHAFRAGIAAQIGIEY